MYTLSEHGDDIVEKRFYPLFIETRFPSYEKFWQREVIPVTKRQPPFFRTDEELRILGKSPLNLYIAQLHYSVLFHLGTAYLFILKTNAEIEYTQLTHAMTAIVAAQDVAFELLTWWNKRSEWHTIMEECKRELASLNKPLMSCFEEKARRWAKEWRDGIRCNRPDICDIARYRNAMVHRGVRAILLIDGVSWFPQIGKQDRYCDWRTARIPDDYAPSSGVLWPAWKQTVAYIEEQWQEVLLHTEN